VSGRPDALTRHWRDWLGAADTDLADLGRAGRSPALRLVGSPARDLPGWDGELHQVVGVVDPGGSAVISLPPARVAAALPLVEAGADVDQVRKALPGTIDLPGHIVYRAVYRWSTAPTPATELADAGAWIPAEDPRVPRWLRPFGGEVLLALEGDRYLAGVGLKRHDRYGREIAVGTEEGARGRGLARRLVAQAARRVREDGGIATYQHDVHNLASARVADAAGFPDLGWTALGIAAVDG
jgi:RimJ/RimL family protein N-acetyltransferase